MLSVVELGRTLVGTEPPAIELSSSLHFPPAGLTGEGDPLARVLDPRRRFVELPTLRRAILRRVSNLIGNPPASTRAPRVRTGFPSRPLLVPSVQVGLLPSTSSGTVSLVPCPSVGCMDLKCHPTTLPNTGPNFNWSTKWASGHDEDPTEVGSFSQMVFRMICMRSTHFRVHLMLSHAFVTLAIPRGFKMTIETISSKTQPFQNSSTLWFSSTSSE